MRGTLLRGHQFDQEWPAAFVRDLQQIGELPKRRGAKLFDRVVADKALVTGYHFPFPAVGKIVADGAGYTFVPAA